MWARRGSRTVPRSTSYETQRHSDSHWGRPTLKMHSLYVGHQMACGGALSCGLGLEDEPPRGGTKKFGNRCLCGTADRRRCVAFGIQQPPFHNIRRGAASRLSSSHSSTSSTPPQERIRYDMCPEMFTLSLQTEEKGHKQCSPSY